MTVPEDDVIIPVMTKRLHKVGNSYSVILDRQTMNAVGLLPESMVEVRTEDGKIVIEPTSTDPIAEIRLAFKGSDPDLVEAVIDAAARSARADTIREMRKKRGGGLKHGS